MSQRPFLYLLLMSLSLCLPVWSQYSIEEATAISERNRLASQEGLMGDSTGLQNKEFQGVDTLRMRFITIDATLGTHTTVGPDTLPLNFQNYSFPERLNTLIGSSTGNLGSPFQSKVYTQQTAYSPFVFLRSYEQWLTAPDQFVFTNTTKPYTNLRYLTSVGNEQTQEENFSYYVTANANKYLNIGLNYEILYARGFYDRSASRNKLANLFGNYQSPRYEAFWRLAYTYIENMENGGITDDRYITQPLLMSGGSKEYESLNIPTNLDDAKSRLKNHQLFFNHKYHIGFERAEKTDSLKKQFVPVTSLTHTLFIDQSQRSYSSETINLTYYDSITNISDTYTADTAALLLIRNTFGLSLREGFHDWVKMGLTAFVEHDFRRYTRLAANATLHDSADAFSGWKVHNENLVWGGATLSKQLGSVLTYYVLGKLCLLGEDFGDAEITGNLNTHLSLWNHPVALEAGGFLKNLHPDYFIEHYYSNHFSWNNTFANEYKTRVYGDLHIPALGFRFRATLENATNPVFFNAAALPEQFNGSVQVFTANWKQDLSVGVIHWDNDLMYQATSNPSVLPLPMLIVYSNLYAKGMLSKVLTTQVGVDCRYNTAYYAPGYMPATGVFYAQNTTKIGNYPYMNAYANFHLKRMRFFVLYSHLSRLFASPNYFSAPHYPTNPAHFKVGLSWNFYD